MKLVVAIVRPERLSDVLEELFKAEVQGLTISRVQGHGGETRARRDLSRHDGEDGAVREGAARDRRLEPLRRADRAGDPRGARTGEVGDGKIFVLPVEKVFRIRTGEEDQEAVTPVKMATT